MQELKKYMVSEENYYKETSEVVRYKNIGYKRWSDIFVPLNVYT